MAEVQIERRKQRGTVGNIYKGRVTRVLPGMQSAFVDVGLEKDAFLYVADVGEEVDDFDAFGSGGAAATLETLPAPAEGAPGSGRRRGAAEADPPVDRRASAGRSGARRAGHEGPDRAQRRARHDARHASGPHARLHAHDRPRRRLAAHRERGRAEPPQGHPHEPQEGPRRVHRAHGGRRARAGGVRGRPPLPHEALGADPQEGRARGGADAPPPRPRPHAPRRARRLRLGLRDALGGRRRGVPAHRRVPRPGAARRSSRRSSSSASRRRSSRSTASRPRSRTRSSRRSGSSPAATSSSTRPKRSSRST